jgi:hypothetical protein
MTEQTAIQFASKYNIRLALIGKPEPKDNVFLYTLKLSRGRQKYIFQYGQPILNGLPGLSDIFERLAKYKPEYEEFKEDMDDKRAKKLYKILCKEYKAVKRIFPEYILEDLKNNL